MLRALAADLSAVPSAHVQIIADGRALPGSLPACELVSVNRAEEERSLLETLAAGADWTVLIAPEFDRCLLDRCLMVESSGGRLLGPSSDLVALLSDKQRTADHLMTRCVPVPSGLTLQPGDPLPADLSCPMVIKPNDGAGSQDTYFCRDRAAAERAWRTYRRLARVEEYVPGAPASVAFLGGPKGSVALEPCLQRVQLGDAILYLGGSLPLPAPLRERALAVAARAVACLPTWIGYLGVDLILGNDRKGAGDCVVEINPRLTTSYVGLRAATRSNLALAMLDVAEGPMPTLSFGKESLEFDADGTVRRTGGATEP